MGTIKVTATMGYNRGFLHKELDKILDRLQFELKHAANVDLTVQFERCVADDSAVGYMALLRHRFEVEMWLLKSGRYFVEAAQLRQSVTLEGDDLHTDELVWKEAEVDLYVPRKGGSYLKTVNSDIE